MGLALSKAHKFHGKLIKLFVPNPAEILLSFSNVTVVPFSQGSTYKSQGNNNRILSLPLKTLVCGNNKEN